MRHSASFYSLFSRSFSLPSFGCGGSFLPRAAALLTALAAGCGKRPDRVVVVYTALDRSYSEPILRRFTERTGIVARAKYDTESTKTVGLVTAIRAERARPRCDVFWNNEIVNTIRLQREGLLARYRSPAAAAMPKAFRDPDGCWTGFAARCRVLIVNTRLVPARLAPRSLADLARPAWRGRAAIAKPLFGSTATHVACLFAALGPARARRLLAALKANDIVIAGSNRDAARRVAEGELAVAATDSDDAVIERQAGRPVAIVFADAGERGSGLLLIPNTVALIRGAPHPEAGKRLIDYLLSPEVEAALAACPSRQIPLRPGAAPPPGLGFPASAPRMAVDFDKAASAFDAAARFVQEEFLR